MDFYKPAALGETGIEQIKQDRTLTDLQKERDVTIEAEERARQQDALSFLNPKLFS